MCTEYSSKNLRLLFNSCLHTEDNLNSSRRYTLFLRVSRKMEDTTFCTTETEDRGLVETETTVEAVVRVPRRY
jgi:hypothetical protein